MSETETTVEKKETPTAISPCDGCIAALEGACLGLIVGGVIVAAPEEVTLTAIVLALSALGMAFGADQIRAWLKEAISLGITTAKALAEFFCKKVGIC